MESADLSKDKVGNEFLCDLCVLCGYQGVISMATAAVPKTKIAGGSFLIEDRQPEEVFTPEDFTDEHRQIAQTTEEFALKEIVPNLEKIEHKEFSVTRDLIKKASELGLTSVDIPEEYGGMEMDK